MGMIVCYVRCEWCMWATEKRHHPDGPHSWMGDEDREHAERTGQIPAGMTDEQLTESHPCNCWCNGRKSSEVIA